jgi:hypothetical protein
MSENNRAETRIQWHDVQDRAAFWYVRQSMVGRVTVAEPREALMRALWDAVRRASVGESVRQPERGEA